MERLAMLAALNTVKPALATKDLVEELAHVWFDGKTITAYNDADLGIQVPFECPFKGGIRGSIILGLLTNSRARDVFLEPGETEGQMLLKAAKLKVKLAVLGEDRSVWKFPEVSTKKTFDIGEQFIDALRSVLVAVGNDTSIPEKLGVTLIMARTQGFTFYTTDSKSIAQADCPTPKGATAVGRIILPTEFCRQVLRCCAKGGFMEITNNHAVAGNGDGVLIYARLVDNGEKPLDFADVVNKNMQFSKKAEFEIPGKLELALERAMVLLEGLDGEPISLSIDKGIMTLEAQAEGRGHLKDTIQVPETVPAIKIKMDPGMIKRALSLSVDMALGAKAVVMLADNFTYLASTKGGN